MAAMCDYCVLHGMEASALFAGKGPTKCASCGTRMGGAAALSAPQAALPVAAAAVSTSAPAANAKPRFKADVDMWCGAEPTSAAIRDAWAGAAKAGSAEEALALLSEAITLGCKKDDGARMDDDPDDVAKQAAASAAAALCPEDQARLYSNRSAVHLAMGERMRAANDGRVSAELFPGWWRGHWVKGQALLAGLEGKAPSSFNAGKAEAAGRALQAALASPSLPARQRSAVEQQAEASKALLYSLNPTCAQM